MKGLFVIFGTDNKERKIIYKNGDWVFSDNGKPYPQNLRLSRLFKKKANPKGVRQPIDFTGLDELAREVEEKLANGEMKKDQKETSVC